MSEDSKGTVTFKDTEYNVKDLNNRAQQLVGLVQAVRGEAQGLQDRLNILQAAELKFSEELEGELTSMNSITEEEEQEEFSGFGS